MIILAMPSQMKTPTRQAGETKLGFVWSMRQAVALVPAVAKSQSRRQEIWEAMS